MHCLLSTLRFRKLTIDGAQFQFVTQAGLGQNFDQSEPSAAVRTRHLVNKTAIFLSWLSVFSVVSCYNVGIKTIIHHTLKLYQLSENDSSMQNVVPFLILIPYTKFKNRYHSELVNRILSKTVLLLTDKAENSEHWAWNISKEGQKRSDIKTVSLLSQRNLSQREKKIEKQICFMFSFCPTATFF